jgi:hypothetical protein
MKVAKTSKAWLLVLVVAASELFWGVQFLGRAGVVRYRSLALGCLVAVPRGAGDAGHVPRRQYSDDGDAQSATASGLSGRHRPSATLCAASPAAGGGVSRQPQSIPAGARM